MAEHPHPVDIHVGSRVRLSRTLAGLSQQKLAGLLGLTFQQVQKYEKGTNRISASKMWEICRILNITPAHLFEGLEHGSGVEMTLADPSMDEASSIDVDGLFRREILELVRGFDRIQDQTVRRNIRELVRSLGSDAD